MVKKKATTVEKLDDKNEMTMDLNKETNANEHTQEDKEKLEKELSQDNVVARVVSWTGNYLKVKFLRDGKPFVTYKGKDGSEASAKKALSDALKSEEKANS